MDIAVVIPVFNEGELVIDVMKSIPKSVKFIIIVNDCSTDKTQSLINKFISSQSCDNRYHFMDLKKNLGVGGATLAGFLYSLKLGAKIFVKIDGDGQMPIEYLYSLIRPILDKKADITKGNRLFSLNSMKSMPKIRLIGNIYLSLLMIIFTRSFRSTDPQNGYIAISKDFFIKLRIENLKSRYAFENSLLIEALRNQARLSTIAIPSRYAGEKSHISIGKFILDIFWFFFQSSLGLIHEFKPPKMEYKELKF